MTESIELDDELNDAIRRLAEQRRLSPREIVHEAIVGYAARASSRHEFLQEADASWDAYGRDGLHLTGSEVSEWLKAEDPDGHPPMPTCHD